MKLIISVILLFSSFSNSYCQNNSDTTATITNPQIDSSKTLDNKNGITVRSTLKRSLLYGTIGMGSGFLVSLPIVMNMKQERGDPGIKRAVVMAGLTGIGATAGILFGASSGFKEETKLNKIDNSSKINNLNQTVFYLFLNSGFSHYKRNNKHLNSLEIMINKNMNSSYIPDFYSLSYEEVDWAGSKYGGVEDKFSLKGMYKYVPFKGIGFSLNYGVESGLSFSSRWKVYSEIDPKTFSSITGKKERYLIPFLNFIGGIEFSSFELFYIGLLVVVEPVGSQIPIQGDNYASLNAVNFKVNCGLRLFSYN